MRVIVGGADSCNGRGLRLRRVRWPYIGFYALGPSLRPYAQVLLFPGKRDGAGFSFSWRPKALAEPRARERSVFRAQVKTRRKRHILAPKAQKYRENEKKLH